MQRDALIDQHRLARVPFLPAVAYSELAAEFYALQTGIKPPYVLRGLTFSQPFKLFHEQPRELFMEGTAIDDAWNVEIQSHFRPVRSEDTQVILHSRAIVSGELGSYADLDPRTWSLETEGLRSLPPQESLMLMQNSGPEQRIILGPLYNDTVRDAGGKEPVAIYPGSTIYPTYFPLEQLSNPKYPLHQALTNPCFLDSIYQACAAHLLVNKQRVYLPWEVQELFILYVPREPGLYRSYTQVVEDSGDVVGFNVAMVDANGRICYAARRARFRRINL